MVNHPTDLPGSGPFSFSTWIDTLTRRASEGQAPISGFDDSPSLARRVSVLGIGSS
jgi:hypothetical protein